MSSKIPLIDFAPFRKGNAATRKMVASQIYSACHEIGFMYLKNPGIDSDLIAKTFEYSQKLFDLPLSEKNNLAWSDELSNCGYVGVGREHLDESKPGDLKEAYNIGRDSSLTEISDHNRWSNELRSSDVAFSNGEALQSLPALGCRIAEGNRWLEGDDLFRNTMLDFFSSCNETAQVICKAMAIALNLPETFFINNHDQQDNTLRLLHYPPLDETPEPEQLRAGEHSDYGSFTLLFQDAVGGLEVRNTDGEWIEALFIPETILVNTGDLIERWTNHVFRSTKHRVRIPQDQRAKQSRYAIAYFCHPNPDTEISCLKTCQSVEHPPLYPPITAGDYLLARLKATY